MKSLVRPRHPGPADRPPVYGFRLRASLGAGIALAAAAVAAMWWNRAGREEPDTSVAGHAVVDVGSDATIDGLGVVTTDLWRKHREAQEKKYDPQFDGWQSEEFIERIDAPLSKIKSLLTRRSAIAAKDVADLITSDFQTSPLRPPALAEVFRQGSLTVRRASGDAAPAYTPPLHGAEGFAAALGELLTPLRSATENHAHTKTTRVELAGDVATTRLLLEFSGPCSADGSNVVQVHATYECRWRLVENSPRLAAIRTLDYEECVSQGRPWLADVTHAVLAHNAAYREQLTYGLDHWLGRIERSHDMDVYGRHGMAVGDVNGDGLDDVYICQPGGLPNRLFVQNPDGTATDRSGEAGVDWLDRTASAIFADLDNDSDQDLVVATFAGLLVMENDGHAHFTLRETLKLVDNDVQSLSAVDYDNDGDLDLYICTEFADLARYKDTPPPRFVYHDANDGGKNVLFRNDMGRAGRPWKFTDVTVEIGLDADNRRHSLAAAWEDFDNDGDQDLYVANDYGQKCLYRNDAGKFTNIAAPAGVTDFGSGMSVAWGDVDRDGWMDLYVANMFSSAGNRITRQAAFMTGVDAPTREIYQRFAKGNSLFANAGDGKFHEIGAEAGVEMGRWAWSSLFTDLNNDGREDIVVANGYITGDEPDDL